MDRKCGSGSHLSFSRRLTGTWKRNGFGQAKLPDGAEELPLRLRRADAEICVPQYYRLLVAQYFFDEVECAAAFDFGFAKKARLFRHPAGTVLVKGDDRGRCPRLISWTALR